MARNVKIVIFIVSICAILSIAIVYKISDEGVVLVGPDSVSPSRDDRESLNILRLVPKTTSAMHKIVARKNPNTVIEKDPLQKIRDALWFNRAPFSTMADEQMALIGMLNDERYVEDWPDVIKYLAYAGESDLATSTIIEYASRREDTALLSTLHPRRRDDLLRTKFCGIFLLGLTRGEEAIEYLRKSISVDGAAEIADSWVPILESVSTDIDKESISRAVRGRAALGLVLTQDPENVEIARDLYMKTNSYLRTAAGPRLSPSARHRPHGADHRSAERLHGFLVDVMATNDLIKDVGIDEYKLISLQPEERIRLSLEYGEKYSFDYWNYE